LLTTKELAAELRVGKSKIALLRDEGMPHIKMGRTIRFNLEDVLEWLKKTYAKEGGSSRPSG